MRAIFPIICGFILAGHCAGCHSTTAAENFKNEMAYPDSSILGKVYSHLFEIPFFKEFTHGTSGSFPQGYKKHYQVSLVHGQADSYVLLKRFLKPPGFPHKLLDTLHLPGYDRNLHTFSFGYCTRNGRRGEGAFVAWFPKSGEKLLSQPIRAWEVDMEKGVFVATSPAGISCPNDSSPAAASSLPDLH